MKRNFFDIKKRGAKISKISPFSQIETIIPIKDGYQIEVEANDAYKKIRENLHLYSNIKIESILNKIDWYPDKKKLKKYEVDFNSEPFKFKKSGLELEGKYIFCLMPSKSLEDPILFCCSINETKVKHTFLSSGKPVLAAGMLVFKDNQLVEINNHSGHYKPTDNDFLEIIKEFKKINPSLATYTSYSTEIPISYSIELNDNNIRLTKADIEIEPYDNSGDYNNPQELIIKEKNIVNRLFLTLKPKQIEIYEIVISVVNNGMTSMVIPESISFQPDNSSLSFFHSSTEEGTDYTKKLLYLMWESSEKAKIDKALSDEGDPMKLGNDGILISPANNVRPSIVLQESISLSPDNSSFNGPITDKVTFDRQEISDGFNPSFFDSSTEDEPDYTRQLLELMWQSSENAKIDKALSHEGDPIRYEHIQRL